MKRMKTSETGMMASATEGQLPADAEHHHQNAQDGGDRGDDLGDALVERLAQGVDVVGHAESTSPWLTRSKYPSGMRLIFRAISFRML